MGGLKNRQVKRGAERQRVARPAPALRSALPRGPWRLGRAEGLVRWFRFPGKGAA